MDVDLTKMTARLTDGESWDEVVIKRLAYSGKTEFVVGRWTAQYKCASRVYEFISNGEASFSPAWVLAKRDMRKRLSEKKIIFGIIKYQPDFRGKDETLCAVLVPKAWLLHEFRSDTLITEGNHAR